MIIRLDLLKIQYTASLQLYKKSAYNNEGMKNLISNYKQIMEACVENLYKTEIGEFKGNKTISILSGDKRVVSFGLSKAKAILASYEDIKAFVEANDKTQTATVDMSNLTLEQQLLVKAFTQKQ